MLHSKISRRLFISFLFFSTIVLSLLCSYLIYNEYSRDMQQQRDTMIKNTQIISSVLEPLAGHKKKSPLQIADLKRQTRELSDVSNLRITVMDFEGNIVADTIDVEEAEENHLQRIEVQEALKNGIGVASRYSNTTKDNLLYVAIPIYCVHGNLHGIVRTSTSTRPIEENLMSNITSTVYALLVTILIASLITFFLSRRIVGPIKEMTADALEISKGDLTKRLSIHTGDELEILSNTINHLTNSMAKNIHELESSNWQKKLILENMDNCVLLLNKHGRIIDLNREATDSFSMDGATLINKNIDILGNSVLYDTVKNMDKKESSVTLTQDIMTARGTRTYSIFIASFKYDSEMQILCVFHDISLLLEMSTRQSEFITNAAHELRTPLTSISGFAETLLYDDFSNPDSSHHFASIIYDEANHMSLLLKDLLQLARMESGDYQRQLHITAVECTELPKIIQTRFSQQIEDHGQKLVVECCEEPLYVQANSELILQILGNLTENAMKYTPEGGAITLSCQHNPEDDTVRLAVKDSGIGIAKKDLNYIFDRFYRADKTRTRETGGNGIGLSLVHFLVRILGGKITVESTPGQGSEFIVTFKRTYIEEK